MRPGVFYSISSWYIHTKLNNKIHLSVSKVTSVPPELTGQVSLYQEVDLSYSSILELPPTLPLTLPHLTHLLLTHNQVP
jgi:hypothetical protein